MSAGCSVGLAQSSVEVRFEGLHIETDVYVGASGLPSVPRALVDYTLVCLLAAPPLARHLYAHAVARLRALAPCARVCCDRVHAWRQWCKRKALRDAGAPHAVPLRVSPFPAAGMCVCEGGGGGGLLRWPDCDVHCAQMMCRDCVAQAPFTAMGLRLGRKHKMPILKRCSGILKPVCLLQSWAGWTKAATGPKGSTVLLSAVIDFVSCA